VDERWCVACLRHLTISRCSSVWLTVATMLPLCFNGDARNVNNSHEKKRWNAALLWRWMAWLGDWHPLLFVRPLCHDPAQFYGRTRPPRHSLDVLCPSRCRALSWMDTINSPYSRSLLSNQSLSRAWRSVTTAVVGLLFPGAAGLRVAAARFPGPMARR